MAYNDPMSRNEAILQNINGANNTLLKPQSKIEEILQAILYQKDVSISDAEFGRIARILIAIKTGGSYSGKAQSRNEEILLCKLKGTAYTKQPQSRIEELLIDWLSVPEYRDITTSEGNLVDHSGNQIIGRRLEA